MSKKLLTTLLVIVIVLLVIIGVVLGIKLSSNEAGSPSPYSAVYLSTGDIYFGKFSRFPFPHMTSAWYLQRGTDAQNQPQLGVAPLSTVFWGPVDNIRFNPDDIVFSVRLRNDSEVAKVIQNPTTPTPSQAPPATQPASTSSIE